MKRALIALFALGLTGCFRGMPSEEPPIHPQLNMFKQGKVRPQAESVFFEDGAAMRPAVPGTIPRGFLLEDKTVPPVTAANMKRGRERFDIYCASCHDRVGTGKGIMVEKGLPPPPSYHEARLLEAPDSHFFDVITNGIRNMPSHAAQIPVEDRWRIVQYVRALQRSQNARASDVPAEILPTLAAEGVKP